GRMQSEHAKAIAAASELSAQAALAREIRPELVQLREMLATELQRAHDDRQSLLARNGQQQGEIERLTGELARERETLGQLHQALARASAESADLQQALASVSAERTDLARELAQLQHQVPVLQ